MRDSLPPIGKLMRLRWVWAPQYRVLSTVISPNASDSVLTLGEAEEVLSSLHLPAALIIPTVSARCFDGRRTRGALAERLPAGSDHGDDVLAVFLPQL